MGRPSLSEASALIDPFMVYNWDLSFPDIPVGGDSRSLRVKMQTTSVPGMQIEQVTVPFRAIELNYAGRQIYTKTLQTTILETRDISTRKLIRDWMEFARNNGRNSGSYKSQYAKRGVMELYDDIPNVTKTITLIGVFPIQIDDLQVDGSQSQAGVWSVTWSYDYTEDN